VGLPTETVYGIGVVPRLEALEALVAAKQRRPDKGIPLLIDGLDQLGELVILAPVALRLAERFWPGALTLVLPLSVPESLPELLTGGRDSLAVRVPDHPVPRTLARELGPLAVSSANRSGEPEARTARELLAQLGASLAVVLDDGPVRGGVASSVVAVDRSGAISVLREGALGRSVIEAALVTT
jgi:tRNA threonylcarbamoyl adenosine modification protein (Sua5/YciO/YrdC/YwlC family)